MANQKLNLDVGRQTVLSASIAFGFAHITDTGIPVVAIKLPYGAQVVSGHIVVDEVFNAATSIVLDVGDSTTPNRYKNDADLKTALGLQTIAPTGYVSDGADIIITPVIVGAVPTTGKARLVVNYVIAGRAGEVQPN